MFGRGLTAVRAALKISSPSLVLVHVRILHRGGGEVVG